eukprot:scaffold5700_cov125-Skeletonema_marinoi.AAC.10
MKRRRILAGCESVVPLSVECGSEITYCNDEEGMLCCWRNIHSFEEFQRAINSALQCHRGNRLGYCLGYCQRKIDWWLLSRRVYYECTTKKYILGRYAALSQHLLLPPHHLTNRCDSCSYGTRATPQHTDGTPTPGPTWQPTPLPTTSQPTVEPTAVTPVPTKSPQATPKPTAELVVNRENRCGQNELQAREACGNVCET